MEAGAKKILIGIIVALAVFFAMVFIVAMTTFHYGTPLARPLKSDFK